jgi:hypothetical protein
VIGIIDIRYGHDSEYGIDRVLLPLSSPDGIDASLILMAIAVVQPPSLCQQALPRSSWIANLPALSCYDLHQGNP